MRQLIAVFLLAAFAADARAVTIAWVPVGNPGNSPDTGVSSLGAVNYSYSIGQFDVTVAQYVEFLNTKDASGADPLGLYNNTGIAYSTYGQINFNAGNASGSKYSAMAGDANHPANYVTWYDAIRFANWLNNGQGNGDTETGSYTLLGGTPTPSNAASITRNAGVTVFLPNANEWEKAAYYDPRTPAQGGPPVSSHNYWLYPTSSNTAPHATGPTATPNSANYNDTVLNLTNVGAYTGTTSPYGAYDMGGDVSQWNEHLFIDGSRGHRGASFLDSSTAMQAPTSSGSDPATPGAIVGFRLVMLIPEPSGLALAALGFAGLAVWGWRKRS
jgi:sulfatase modifying factor 1